MIRLALIIFSTLAVAHFSFADDHKSSSKKEQHVEVSMRMIGHQVLLSLGDSTSRVLPIEKEGEQYKVRFENDFAFNPETVAQTIDSVIQATQIASSYIVSFESCELQQVVHSYEVGISEEMNVLACATRDQPKACYNLLITILEPSMVESKPVLTASAGNNQTNKYMVLAILLVFVLLPMIIAPLLLNRKTKPKTIIEENVTSIGLYKFNKRSMELILGEEKIELTSKECDLLQLLCDSTNNTVERETILKMVWGDEGDYVGRTLDVFISKLRKKLEGDSNVRIANIRGVGYKLIVDGCY